MAGVFKAAVGTWFVYIVIMIIFVIIISLILSMFGTKTEHMTSGKFLSMGILAIIAMFVGTILFQIFMTYVTGELYIWWRYPDAVMINSQLQESEQNSILKKALLDTKS
jgi:nicotinamide riboside transporter PnuC